MPLNEDFDMNVHDFSKWVKAFKDCGITPHIENYKLVLKGGEDLPRVLYSRYLKKHINIRNGLTRYLIDEGLIR